MSGDQIPNDQQAVYDNFKVDPRTDAMVDEVVKKFLGQTSRPASLPAQPQTQPKADKAKVSKEGHKR